MNTTEAEITECLSPIRCLDPKSSRDRVVEIEHSDGSLDGVVGCD